MPSEYEAEIAKSLMTAGLRKTREVRDLGGDGFSIMGSYGGTKLTYTDRVHDIPTRGSSGIGSVVESYSRGNNYLAASVTAMVGNPKIEYIRAERDQKSLGCVVGYSGN